MPFGHLPYVTLHQGPLNIQQLLTATLAHLRTGNHPRPSQSVLFPTLLFLCVNIYICIVLLREARAWHIYSHACSFVTLLEHIPAPRPA